MRIFFSFFCARSPVCCEGSTFSTHISNLLLFVDSCCGFIYGFTKGRIELLYLSRCFYIRFRSNPCNDGKYFLHTFLVYNRIMSMLLVTIEGVHAIVTIEGVHAVVTVTYMNPFSSSRRSLLSPAIHYLLS